MSYASWWNNPVIFGTCTFPVWPATSSGCWGRSVTKALKFLLSTCSFCQQTRTIAFNETAQFGRRCIGNGCRRMEWDQYHPWPPPRRWKQTKTDALGPFPPIFILLPHGPSPWQSARRNLSLAVLRMNDHLTFWKYLSISTIGTRNRWNIPAKYFKGSKRGMQGGANKRHYNLYTFLTCTLHTLPN